MFFSIFTKQEAENVCAARGLQNTLLDNCVFDILMTNDTSFAEQQSLQIGMYPMYDCLTALLTQDMISII